MRKNIRIGLLTGMGILSALPAFGSQVYITGFNKTGNMQTDLQASFPSGTPCDSGGFGPIVCFNIGASNVNNYELVNTFDAIAVNATGVTKIWMLLNADLAQNGQNFATVFLSVTNPTTQSINLITGIDVSDYHQG